MICIMEARRLEFVLDLDRIGGIYPTRVIHNYVSLGIFPGLFDSSHGLRSQNSSLIMSK